MSKLSGFVTLIQTAIDKGVTSIENVHKTTIDNHYNKVGKFIPAMEITANLHALQLQSTVGVYEIIRLVNQKAGHMVQSILEDIDKIKTSEAECCNFANNPCSDALKSSPPSVEKGISILNGIFGDYLHEQKNALAIDMQYYHDNRPLHLTQENIQKVHPTHTSKICILVHGLVCNETIWNFVDDHETTYGSLLHSDLGYTPFYLRYNTGRHISENGKMLSNLITTLYNNFPQEIDEIILIGHSMGGLVIRSGCWYGTQEAAKWVKKVKKVFFIATPHLGAPLEKFGNVVSGVLKEIPMAYTKLAGEIIDLRSEGIKDLRFGYILDEEWKGGNPDAILENNKKQVSPLKGASHYVISGSLTINPDHPITKILGDPMVRKMSAMGNARQKKFRLPIHGYREFGNIGHIKVAHCQEVYGQIKRWCQEKQWVGMNRRES